MYNWTQNISLPKLSDVLNGSDVPMNFMQIFTYAWVWFLGGWFFAALIGAFGAALYIKYDNPMPAVVFFIISILLLGGTGGIFFVSTPNMPDASVFVYIVGLLSAVTIGIVLYMLFVSKKE